MGPLQNWVDILQCAAGFLHVKLGLNEPLSKLHPEVVRSHGPCDLLLIQFRGSDVDLKWDHQLLSCFNWGLLIDLPPHNIY